MECARNYDMNNNKEHVQVIIVFLLDGKYNKINSNDNERNTGDNKVNNP